MSAKELLSGRRQWRAMVKKLRRKKMRQKAAQERERNMKDEENARLEDPDHRYWLQQQSALQEFQDQAEERQRLEAEKQWLRREKIAQQQFLVERQRLKADEAQREAELLKQEKELEEQEEQKRKKREEKHRLAREAAAEFERMLERMDEFLADPEMEIPPELSRYAETHPGRDLCHFFERTNCCRFGLPCVYNHRRPMLSRILLVRHFFSHPQLEQTEHHEYGTDVMLEFSESDLQEAYKEFFEDVISEMESFGEIRNFRTGNNSQAHLRGHVLIEYTNERSALKAFIRLQGRYYAKKRLNVEFSNITVWRTAVCGLSFIQKCPQGRNCLYLHLFSNPNNKYNVMLEVTGSKRGLPSARKQFATPLISWTDLGRNVDLTPNSTQQSRNWRWSESPEVELKSKSPNDVSDENETSKTEKQVNDSKRHRRRSRSKDSKRKSYKSRRRNHSRSRSRSKSPKRRDHESRSSRRNKHHGAKRNGSRVENRN